VIDTAVANSYLDVGLTNGLDYYYYITAIDSFQNVSFNSDTVTAYPMGLDSGILLVNGNVEGSINPDYDSMLVFYDNILQNYQYTRIDVDIGNLTEMAPYSTVLFVKESILGGRLFIYSKHLIYRKYLDAGGNIIIAGAKQMAPNPNYWGLVEYYNPDFQYQYLNLASTEYASIIDNMEFSGGSAVSSLFDNFALDSARTDRIPYPIGMPYGRYPGISVMTPRDNSEVIYNYISATPDTSNYHGRPVGIVHQTDTYNTAVLEFPLYYVEEPISYQILHQILSDFGETPVGIDDNSVLLPKSTQLLQNYPNPFNNSTTLKYDLTKAGEVSITIYSILGQKVAEPVNGYQQPGAKTITWRADDLPSGIYFARMKTEDYSGSIKLMLLK